MSETIRKGIVGKAAAGGTLRSSVFKGAVEPKKRAGAAISRETQEFLSCVLLTTRTGYGMTESCGMCAIMPPEVFRFDSVGLSVPSIEIKLRDVPEAGYFSCGRHGATEERGRLVCIRGPFVISGYYKRPDLNADETIFAGDGWMRTGDVGRWNEDGMLALIDCIKNLVKLAGGEYIALEVLESTYKSCNYVANICVHATQDAKAPIAIIIPHEQNLSAALKNEDGVDAGAEMHHLCTDPKVAALVLRECNAVGKKSGFKAMETLSAVVLTPDERTPESGLVTAAQKIQRTAISKKFDKEIKEAYKNQ
ncbi:hypothetical protein B0H16DRAFT_1553948 [Mycena metata]|uniref:AMP-dependent synthetase/ligase domain-containing protein n=1 Tax=Mycena metata TaxID=1033252 RepID=A0AAD7IQ20_9AGAR|nr:hypothetical protein B0H16DRAFT_1553948 [Mycena metata]